MPEQYDDTNRGVLFKNDRKETDQQPDYTGKVNVQGEEKRLAGWIRQSKAGKTFLSLSISDPLPPPELRQADGPALPKDDQPLDDDIPF